MEKRNEKRSKNMEGRNERVARGKREGEIWLERIEQWEAEKEMLCRRIRKLELKEQRKEREKRECNVLIWEVKWRGGGDTEQEYGEGLHKRRGKRGSEYKES